MQKQPLDMTDNLVVWCFYGFLMGALETALKGKTIGKFITGTRAVDGNGHPVNGQMAFLRGLIRVIPFPFEQISAVNFSFNPFAMLPPYPWHDRWSKTIVVDEGKSLLPKN